jgi:hypothetical protein
LIADSPENAPHYRRDAIDIRAATLHTAIIVKNGTVEGRPTVDFQFKTIDGDEFVAMLTGNLVKQLAAAIAGVEQR